MSSMHIEVVTLFPRMIAGGLEFGVLGRAIERGLVRVGTEDPRAHTRDVHRTVDLVQRMIVVDWPAELE